MMDKLRHAYTKADLNYFLNGIQLKKKQKNRKTKKQNIRTKMEN